MTALASPRPLAGGYAAACAALYALAPLGVQLGLSRITQVLRRLGDPQLRYPALHIAGTNGKGSTAALSAALLLAAARARAGGKPRVGLYTSPHLLRLTERVQVSDARGALAECANEELATVLGTVLAAAAGPLPEVPLPAEAPLEDAAPIELTFFEVLTAAAFLHFAWQGVAVAVIETGLGGRLDATRLCQPLACAVTSVDLDHSELLGDTRAAIAYEKGSIFKVAVPAYVACEDAEALRTLQVLAGAVGAPLTAYPTAAARALGLALLPELTAAQSAALALAGVHQRRNAALALALAYHAPAPLGAPSEQLVLDGLAAVRWPGRLETLPSRDGRHQVVLDGAHNGEGAAALASWLDSPAGAAGAGRVVLWGVVTGKRAEDMLAPLRGAQAIVLCAPDTARARAPASLLPLLAAAGVAAPAMVVSGPVDEALALAERLTPPGGQLVVYGSLFLLAAVRRLLRDEPADPPRLQDPLR